MRISKHVFFSSLFLVGLYTTACPTDPGVPITPSEPTQEPCDWLDNDDDGIIDEGCFTPTETPPSTVVPTYSQTLPSGTETASPTQEPTFLLTSTPPPVTSTIEPTIASTPSMLVEVDEDRDGWTKCHDDYDEDHITCDCNDKDPQVHPDAPETCDGIDNNCDGEKEYSSYYPFPELTAIYWDRDEDGFGDTDDVFVWVCDPDFWDKNSDLSMKGGDCDDTNSLVNPDAHEVYYNDYHPGSGMIACDDGLDNDCSGKADLDDPVCQDSDQDTIPDGVDYMFPCDLDDDGSNEAACFRSDIAWYGPWSEDACVQQKRPYTNLSLEDINEIQSVSWAGTYVDVCPIYPTELGNQDWSAISLLDVLGYWEVNEDNCGSWVRMDLDTYCIDWLDPLCTNATSFIDGCQSVGYALSFMFDGENVSP